ncbi:putative glycosyl transferase family 2 protein [Janthinobacterium sp. HH01]|uniref:glycosyltransferase family 2 protein n=1 Tax=Janthinobacterium sp. HH01 TaxID=1198452 RepID=UPI0002AEDB72|nr:glycosyltransferase family A protein [Janthinobacterium sp. HH01]ELX13525.1 putative glycosyl transferase family 2 protein [Janthinobacterium sp. HH01]
MTPTISIVVPAYNVQHYIAPCVRSILAQMGDRHELVVVDDGSSDDTLAVLMALRQSWGRPNFRLCGQTNQGVASARNHCVAAARGEYIAFVDSDDVLRDGALAAIERAIDSDHPDVIAVDFTMWHPDRPDKNHAVALDYPAGVLRDPEAILLHFMGNRHMYVWAHVIRRARYAELPAPIFPPGPVFEDVATLPRLISLCASMVHIPRQVIDYRQHPTSISQSISEQWCMDFLAALAVARRHLEQRAIGTLAQAHFDLMIAHFYVALVKSSYQLPNAVGRRARAHSKAAFADLLFGDCAALRAVGGARDRRMLEDLHKILSGNLAFHLKHMASRQYKRWRTARKLRGYLAALNSRRRRATVAILR